MRARPYGWVSAVLALNYCTQGVQTLACSHFILLVQHVSNCHRLAGVLGVQAERERERERDYNALASQQV